MAGSAKQSIKPHRKDGLLRRFAPRNDGTLISNSKDNSGVEPSLRAKQSNPSRRKESMDCFVASLLAMTAL
jgi:hypothetical protein